MNLSELQQVASSIESLITALGIIVAGVWTYRRFIRQRAGRGKARVSHRIQAWQVAAGHTMLNVDITISNIGSVLIPLRLVKTILYRVLPLSAELTHRIQQGNHVFEEDGRKDPWPKIDRRVWTWQPNESEIEPGESHRLHSQFLLPEPISVVKLITYLKDSTTSRDLGWLEETVTSIKSTDKEGMTDVEQKSNLDQPLVFGVVEPEDPEPDDDQQKGPDPDPRPSVAPKR